MWLGQKGAWKRGNLNAINGAQSAAYWYWYITLLQFITVYL